MRVAVCVAAVSTLTDVHIVAQPMVLSPRPRPRTRKRPVVVGALGLVKDKPRDPARGQQRVHCVAVVDNPRVVRSDVVGVEAGNRHLPIRITYEPPKATIISEFRDRKGPGTARI